MDDKAAPRNRAEGEILGYQNVLSLVHEEYDEISVRPSYILQIHRDLLRFTNLSYGGSFKTTPNEIDMVLSNGKKVIFFKPVEPYETPDAVNTVCESYKEALEKEFVHPLILKTICSMPDAVMLVLSLAEMR